MGIKHQIIVMDLWLLTTQCNLNLVTIIVCITKNKMNNINIDRHKQIKLMNLTHIHFLILNQIHWCKIQANQLQGTHKIWVRIIVIIIVIIVVWLRDTKEYLRVISREWGGLFLWGIPYDTELKNKINLNKLFNILMRKA